MSRGPPLLHSALQRRRHQVSSETACLKWFLRDTWYMENTQSASKEKRQVAELLKSIETGDHGPISYIDPQKYIQHNLAAAGRTAGLWGADAAASAELSQGRDPPSLPGWRVRVHPHGLQLLRPQQIGFDIFRFEGGKVVEHWDNLQETPTAPNPSGHTMIDGPSDARASRRPSAIRTWCAISSRASWSKVTWRSSATSTGTTTSNTTLT